MTTNGGSRRLCFAACAASLALAVSAGAQSLGDVAREEAARRQSTPASGKVYTNADLPAAEPAPVAAAPAAAQSAQTPAAADDKSSAADSEKTTAKGEPTKKDEAYWRERMKAAVDDKARSESFAEALQSRINALSTDFVNRDDPAQRAVIANDRQKALDELARVKKEILDFTKAIEDLKTEARHEGVPPGWLR
jgi:hypothetical protein